VVALSRTTVVRAAAGLDRPADVVVVPGIPADQEGQEEGVDVVVVVVTVRIVATGQGDIDVVVEGSLER
jgi:hypothetical protein